MGDTSGPHYWRTLRRGHGDAEAAQPDHPRPVPLHEGTPLIVRLGGFSAPNVDWETTLADAIARAERDMVDLAGTYYADPACLEPVE